VFDSIKNAMSRRRERVRRRYASVLQRRRLDAGGLELNWRANPMYSRTTYRSISMSIQFTGPSEPMPNHHIVSRAERERDLGLDRCAEIFPFGADLSHESRARRRRQAAPATGGSGVLRLPLPLFM
jgi:hypothetical protein